MVKMNEVMAGNVVWSTEFNRPHFIQWGDCGDYEEIPLTREIMNLLWSKSGSKCSGELLAMNENGKEFETIVRGSEVSQVVYTDNRIYFVNSILSVHQLQNLLTANGLPKAAKEVGEKVMGFMEKEGRK